MATPETNYHYYVDYLKINPVIRASLSSNRALAITTLIGETFFHLASMGLKDSVEDLVKALPDFADVPDDLVKDAIETLTYAMERVEDVSILPELEAEVIANFVTATMLYYFESTGSQIFDFNPLLTQMLRHTDLDIQTPYRESCKHLPYHCFYMHFQNSGVEVLTSDVNMVFEGCLFAMLHNRIDANYPIFLYVVTCRDINDRSSRARIIFNQTLPANLSMGQGLQKIINHNYARFNPNSSATAESVIRLIYNGVSFLTSAGADIKTGYPTHTPSQWKNMACQGQLKERKKAESWLAKHGYMKVHLCGTRIEREHESHIRQYGYEMSPHWRRGHWRNQAIGQGRSSHKLIWIQPTIVRRDKGVPEHGHVYDIR